MTPKARPKALGALGRKIGPKLPKLAQSSPKAPEVVHPRTQKLAGSRSYGARLGQRRCAPLSASLARPQFSQIRAFAKLESREVSLAEAHRPQGRAPALPRVLRDLPRGSRPASHPPVSRAHPEQTPETVRQRAVKGIWCRFSSCSIVRSCSPSSRHARDGFPRPWRRRCSPRICSFFTRDCAAPYATTTDGARRRIVLVRAVRRKPLP